MKDKYLKRAISIGLIFSLILSLGGIGLFPSASYGGTFTENFSTTTYKDSANTTADWNTTAGKVGLPIDGSSWKGAYDSLEEGIYSLAVYNNKLYGGSYPNGKIYVYDGSSWQVSNYSGEDWILSLAVYNNKLYGGSSPNGIIGVYDGSSWQGSYDTLEVAICSLAVYNNKLYAGSSPNGKIYVYDGSSWQVSNYSGEDWILSLAVYNNKLYGGSYPNGIIGVYDGSSWQGSYDSLEEGIYSLAVYNNKLYAGSYPNGKIYVYDGSSWQVSCDSLETYIHSLAVYNNKLYAGSYPNGKIYVYDGSSWQVSYDSPEGGIYSLAVYNNELYAGSGPSGIIYRNSPSYQPSAQAQSIKINTETQNIIKATISANQNLNGQTINYYLSANGGANWEAVTPGVEYTFTHQGNDLRWKAVLSTANSSVTPETDSLTINYITQSTPPPPTEKIIERIFGDNRYETAVEISKKGWDTSDTVIITRGDLFPDALAGSSLASKYNAPILLTWPSELHPSTKAEIERLKPKNIIILGSEDAVSKNVEDNIRTLGITNITRIGGSDRYDTSGLIAKALGAISEKMAFLSTGENFPDALASASLAYYKRIPIFLVGNDKISPEIQQAFPTLQIKKVILLGGTDVVPDGYVNWFISNGATLETRLAGDDRYGTAKAIADYGISKGMNASKVYIATGENFPDALACGPLAGKNNSVILLTSNNLLRTQAKEWLISYKADIYFVYIAGGPGVVSDELKSEIGSIVGAQ